MVAQGNATANHFSSPLNLTTYLAIGHQFRYRLNIEKLYLADKLSAREIAAKLGSSHDSINSAIKKFNITKPIKIRRPKFGRATPNKSESQIKRELKTIALIKRLKKEGTSLRMISKYLNENKIKTPSGAGLWVPSTIKRIIQN